MNNHEEIFSSCNQGGQNLAIHNAAKRNHKFRIRPRTLGHSLRRAIQSLLEKNVKREPSLVFRATIPDKSPSSIIYRGEETCPAPQGGTALAGEVDRHLEETEILLPSCDGGGYLGYPPPLLTFRKRKVRLKARGKRRRQECLGRKKRLSFSLRWKKS